MSITPPEPTPIPHPPEPEPVPGPLEKPDPIEEPPPDYPPDETPEPNPDENDDIPRQNLKSAAERVAHASAAAKLATTSVARPTPPPMAPIIED